MYITASDLYNYVKCPHLIWRDKYGPQGEKIRETNPFVDLLWQRGIQHEEEVVNKIGQFIDLHVGTLEERFERTVKEMKKGTPLLYQGVIMHDNLLGIPDLLKKISENIYVPIDIKSGMGFEGSDEDDVDEGKPKKHYALQLCLYVEILKNLGFAKENNGKIIDISGKEVDYLLDTAQGSKTPESWWGLYQSVKKDVKALLENQQQNKPALSGICKLCCWCNSCKKWCRKESDLTNIFYLGRSRRDVISKDIKIEKMEQLKELNIATILASKKLDKSFLRGIGEELLKKYINRAEIITKTKKPVVYKKIELPKVPTELFFDIEDDPTQDFIYLHGVYKREKGKGEFIPFLAKEFARESEKEAWNMFWTYINSLPLNSYAVYYYSSHEKTAYKHLRERYPDIITQEELEGFFANPNVIDLYSKIILKYTDWPLSSYSIKDIATLLGFKWRDETPSGALSIQWYNEYLKTSDGDILKRILEYNEDDCKAMMVLKDEIESLSNRL